jgi:hypothetical protein
MKGKIVLLTVVMCWLVFSAQGTQKPADLFPYQYEANMHPNAGSPALPSFISESRDIEIHRWIEPNQSSGIDFNAPDMVGMARWAMHYLVCNPQKPLGYECRFSISPLAFPPAPGDNQHDEIAIGDTESRMEVAYIYMREMSKMDVGTAVEDAIRKRLISYLKDDGLCWCLPRASGSRFTGIAASPWATSHLLISTLERYQRTGDKDLLKLARKLVDGLKSKATWKGSMAYYEGGLAPWVDGKWFEECNCYYPMLTGLPLYWEITGENDVLEFTQAMAEGTIAGLQPNLGINKVLIDGSHCSSNGHLTMRGMVGIAQLGRLTGNARYIEFVRRAYEFNRSTGTDWGWYPENIFERDRRYCSETCFTGEMVEAAVALANSGYPEYWDHIERTVRNYLRECQFFVTPEFRAMYEKVHPELSKEQVDTAMNLLKTFEGGFLARQAPNDWIWSPDGKQMCMMGCCPPEGMRSLYFAWANTVVDKGENVFVNMSLDRDSNSCEVKTFAPKQGRLEVCARKNATFHLRPPSWAPQKNIQVYVNDNVMKPDWSGQYIRFRNIKSGDKLRIDYQMPEFTQRVPVGYDRSEDIYHVRWIGNDVIGISPEGKYLPIFKKHRQPLPQLSDPGKWEL